MLRIIGVLLLIPLLEMLLLVVLSTYVGWQLIVLLVVLTAFVGMLLVRAQGRQTLRKIQQKTARGELPADELLDGALLLVSGAFLLTPGLLTDLLGFLLVIPVTRYPIRLAVKKWVVVPYADAKSRGFVTGNVYIDGFPNDGGTADVQGGPGPGSGSSGDTYDMDEDSYDVDDGRE
ncbi:FxsA family protein [Salinibaculum rarum]|uniref:FxsA family protein n=1 Tax=Salinibaculum rarum TaxID=3058903 RepID=UPI00265E7F8F|nr:FxsA family protein [Salinibaculum sp. KK48]